MQKLGPDVSVVKSNTIILNIDWDIHKPQVKINNVHDVGTCPSHYEVVNCWVSKQHVHVWEYFDGLNMQRQCCPSNVKLKRCQLNK